MISPRLKLIMGLLLLSILLTGCSPVGGMRDDCSPPIFNKYSWGAEFEDYEACEKYIGQSCSYNATYLACPELIPK